MTYPYLLQEYNDIYTNQIVPKTLYKIGSIPNIKSIPISSIPAQNEYVVTPSYYNTIMLQNNNNLMYYPPYISKTMLYNNNISYGKLRIESPNLSFTLTINCSCLKDIIYYIYQNAKCNNSNEQQIKIFVKVGDINTCLITTQSKLIEMIRYIANNYGMINITVNDF